MSCNGGNSHQNGSSNNGSTGSRLHDDVSILYDSILTPRSSIVPAQLHSINPAASKNAYCSKHRSGGGGGGVAGFTDHDHDHDSEHADSGRGDSDQEFGQKNKLGPKCSRQCLKFGHSDACWIDGLPTSEINISSISLVYDNSRANGLLTTPGRFIEANSSGYISEDSREQKVLRALLQSTPKKAPKPASMSSGSESLVISTKDGCVINVQGTSRANEGLTVKECPTPTKINIV